MTVMMVLQKNELRVYEPNADSFVYADSSSLRDRFPLWVRLVFSAEGFEIL